MFKCAGRRCLLRELTSSIVACRTIPAHPAHGPSSSFLLVCSMCLWCLSSPSPRLRLPFQPDPSSPLSGSSPLDLVRCSVSEVQPVHLVGSLTPLRGTLKNPMILSLSLRNRWRTRDLCSPSGAALQRTTAGGVRTYFFPCSIGSRARSGDGVKTRRTSQRDLAPPRCNMTRLRTGSAGPCSSSAFCSQRCS